MLAPFLREYAGPPLQKWLGWLPFFQGTVTGIGLFTGGVILARGDDREEIEALAASDPFVSGGVATVAVVQFRASQTAPELKDLL